MTESAPIVPATVLPLFYKEPVALNVEQHRELTVSPSPAGYAFAAAAHTVMLSAVEFFEACRDYPIIFAPAADGSITPLALLGIQPGEIDLPTFPLFALFGPALGMTAIIPDMDPTRPAQVDPAKIVEAIHAKRNAAAAAAV